MFFTYDVTAFYRATVLQNALCILPACLFARPSVCLVCLYFLILQVLQTLTCFSSISRARL